VFVTSRPGSDQFDAREWIHESYRLSQRSQLRNPLLGFVEPLNLALQEPSELPAAFEPLLTDDDPWVRALARLSRGRFRLMFGGSESDVDADFEVALTEFGVLGDRWGISFALTCLADRLAARGEFLRACERYEEAVEALTELGAIEDVVGLRARQAQLYWLLGDERSSTTAITEARRYEDRIGWPDVLAELVLSKAQLARWRGDTDEAYEHLAAVRTILGSADFRGAYRARTQDQYGYLTEDLGRARAHRTEAFHEARETMYLPLIAEVLVGVADLALRQGEYEQAARLLAASDSVRGTADRSLPDASRIAENARRRLGETMFAEATRAGRRQDWRELAEITLAS